MPVVLNSRVGIMVCCSLLLREIFLWERADLGEQRRRLGLVCRWMDVLVLQCGIFMSEFFLSFFSCYCWNWIYFWRKKGSPFLSRDSGSSASRHEFWKSYFLPYLRIEEQTANAYSIVHSPGYQGKSLDTFSYTTPFILRKAFQKHNLQYALNTNFPSYSSE